MNIRPVLILVTIVVLWAVSAALIAWTTPEWEVRGQIGDMFGAVNALFSGLALAGVVYAILLQREDLELQRRELQLNRDELRRSADAQTRAHEALTEQVHLQMVAARVTAIAAVIGHLTQSQGDNPWKVFARSAQGKTAEAYLKELEELIPQLRGPRRAG